MGLSSILSLSSSFQTFTTSPSNSSDLHVHIVLITLFHCLSPIVCPSQILPFFFLVFFFLLFIVPLEAYSRVEEIEISACI